MAEIVSAVLEFGPRSLQAIEVTKLHSHLARRIVGYRDLADEAGATWALIVDLHALGYLDVSQAPMKRMLTGLVLRASTPQTSGGRTQGSSGDYRPMPLGFDERIGGRAARAAREITQLRSWYTDASQCANSGLAEYFRAEELPEGTCGFANCRCSTCWAGLEVAANGEELPRVLRAFRTQNPRPMSSTAQGRPAAERAGPKRAPRR